MTGETCDRVMGAGAAIALGRFNPRGPTGFIAAHPATGVRVRPTRAEAEADALAYACRDCTRCPQSPSPTNESRLP